MGEKRSEDKMRGRRIASKLWQGRPVPRAGQAARLRCGTAVGRRSSLGVAAGVAGRVAGTFLLLLALAGCAGDKPKSSCADCHAGISPKLVADFSRSKMSHKFSCEKCHGISHQGKDDVDKAILPTVWTCRNCHEKQAEQYLEGKHALAHAAIDALPFTHMQPESFVAGQKGCGGCHSMGMLQPSDRERADRKYYRYGMDCRNCHGRHAFSKAEASEPEACMTCHMGFDHPQWEMWSSSKHGVAYIVNRQIAPEKRNRAPKCQTCHMPEGNHRVYSAWGFLGLRLPEEDAAWESDRQTILKGLGVLDPAGNPTERLDLVKRLKMARLSREAFAAERERFVKVCNQCHTPAFVAANFQNADKMLRNADALFAEAIEIVAGLKGEGLLPGGPGYPDLLSLYEVESRAETVLFDMFMDHRMKTFQAGFHMNPDYATWYGYAKLKKDLVEIRELAEALRGE